MGCRIHVVKRQREYGETSSFNYGMEEFVNLLSNLGCDVSQAEGDYYFCEAEVEKFKRAIKVFESYIKHIVDGDNNKKAFLSSLKKLNIAEEDVWYNEEDFFESMTYILTYLEKEDNYDPKYLLGVLKDYLKERDKKSNWIQFEMY
jgi:hypothetical protein